MKARPVGLGACCAVCDDRRRAHLRHFELALRTNYSATATSAPGGRWIVLCYNCAARAEKLKPEPRSLDGIKMRLHRDRRWGDRRAASVGRPSPWRGAERRVADRRDPFARMPDASALAEEVIEIEADYEEISEDRLADIGEITGIHHKI